MKYKVIRYFAFAKDSRGKIRQLKITRIHIPNSIPIKAQGWTDKTYKTIKEANIDMKLLNCIGDKIC